MEISTPLQRSATGPAGVSWPLLTWLLVLAGMLWHPEAANMLGDPDTYWHLKAGQLILERGAIPLSDPFSHSMPGAPWTPHEWLAEVLLAQVHGHAGWAGLGVTATLALAATLALLMRFLLERMEPVHALLLTALSGGMLMSHLLARPHVFAWPLLMLWASRLVDAVEQGRAPSLWLLPLMALWANLHGSFTLGLALLGVLATAAVMDAAPGERMGQARRWGLFAMLALLAAMATPSHWKGLWFTVHVTGLSYSLSVIKEWASPDFHQPQLLELWLLLLLGLGLSGRLRLSWWRTLLLLGLVHLSLKHQRHITVLALLGPLLLALPLARCRQGRPGQAPQAQALDRLFEALRPPARPAALLLCAVLSTLLIGHSLDSPRWAPQPGITPESALRAVRAAGIDGPVFNAYNFGGYLIKEGVPVFIDGRADMYGDAFMRRTAEAVAAHRPEDLGRLLEEYRIAWTLLSPEAPAVRELDRRPGWRRLYGDQVAVVHVRDAEAPPALPSKGRSIHGPR